MKKIVGTSAPPSKQKGISMVLVVFMVAIASIIAIQRTKALQQDYQLKAEKATVDGINKLAQAQTNHFLDRAAPTALSYANTPALLVSRGYLALFTNVNGDGHPYSIGIAGPGAGFSLTTTMDTAGAARRVASAFGGAATATGTTVTVTYPEPATANIFDEFVRRDGSTDIFGVQHFRAGAGAHIDMNDNHIRDVGRLTARNGAATGLVTSDIGSIDTLTVQSFRYVP